MVTALAWSTVVVWELDLWYGWLADWLAPRNTTEGTAQIYQMMGNVRRKNITSVSAV